MFDIERRKGFSNLTVNELISELARMPQNAIVTCCGDLDVWLHVEQNNSYVCIDSENLDDCYGDIEMAEDSSREEIMEEVLEIIELSGQNWGYEDIFDKLVSYFKTVIHRL